jgi:hypothetical protein
MEWIFELFEGSFEGLIKLLDDFAWSGMGGLGTLD